LGFDRILSIAEAWIMDRREFLKFPICAWAGYALSKSEAVFAQSGKEDLRYVREASWYRKSDGGRVECMLCPNRCRVADQKAGTCGVRFNDKGIFSTRVFGRPVTMANDPIEKKPLFHFLPGTDVLSLATVGCNFRCLFCQNWEISQSRPGELPEPYGFVPPEDLIALAKRRGSKSIAFTYSEPVVDFEYVLATAKASKAAGIPTVLISNGYILPGPMEELLTVLGAVKVDFKAFSDDFYQKICEGTLAPVLDTMKLIKQKGVWLEMVHLTIPTLNDEVGQHKQLCKWVLENLGPDVPLHFTRFHPTYKLKNLPPTPPSSLERAHATAKEAGLHYVYVGNLPGHEGENTYCPSCKTRLIWRVGFSVKEMNIKDGKCSKCGKVIPGSWG
jgi:pyruvate formate lyase activating enzyme